MTTRLKASGDRPASGATAPQSRSGSSAATGSSGSTPRTFRSRRADKAQALAGDGITPVDDLLEAVRAAPLVVVCLATYDDVRASLEPATDLTGVTVINVSSGTPLEVEAFDAWVSERGAQNLDGSILGYPEQIGTEQAAVLYSGAEAAWAEHGGTLVLLTPTSVWVYQDVRIASVLNAGLVGMFLVPAVSAYVEASTYMLGEGVDHGLLELLTPAVFASVQDETARVAAAIASGDFSTDQATIATYAQALGSADRIMREARLAPRVFSAALDNLSAAIDAGLGDLGFAAQTRVVAPG